MAADSLELRHDDPCRVGLSDFQGQYGTDWDLLMAAAAIATIPTVIVYLFAQRWFVQGIAMSGFGAGSE